MVNQLSLNFSFHREDINQKITEQKRKSGTEVLNILRIKPDFNLIKVHNEFQYNNMKLKEIELDKGIIKKIYFIYNSKKYCLNIKNYKIKTYNDYYKSYEDEDGGKDVFVIDLDIPSYNQKLSVDKGKEVYGRLLKPENNMFQNFASYVIRYYYTDRNSFGSLKKAA